MRYSTDNLNRLVITKDGRRYHVDGEFKIEKNKLIFEPSRKSAKQLEIARRLKFEGAWQLTPNKDLKIILSETDNQTENDELELRGRIVSAEDDAIVFQISCVKEQGIEKVSLIRLGGRWQADEFNQLAFAVTRNQRQDILRFSGSWQVNNNQQITYTYQKQDLIRKTKTQEEINFKGYWQINSKNRLAYIIDARNGSFFEFRVGLESPSLIGKEGAIRYRIGIGVRRLAKETLLSLFGVWKINRTKSVSFEIDYGEFGIKAITFGASVRLGRDSDLIFELKNREGKDLGFSVQFTRQFFSRNAQLFARFKRLQQDTRIESGIRFKW